ncbi:MAG: DUF4388 domain-containing protein [Gemmatimonadaceae bacterium]
MSLEGNLRDLALAEVCQLLAHTRQSGELRLSAPLAGMSASIRFDGGAIVNATIDGTPVFAASDESTLDLSQQVESVTLEVLGWNEGNFHFLPAEYRDGMPSTGVRLNTEMVLMESARRSAEWARMSDRFPNARAIPAFADVEARQLPLLNLTPQQWEVLTGVDGQRDLSQLAHALGRELLAVAETVHNLLGIGLLRLVESVRVIRTQATPPSSAAEPSASEIDLWVPSENELLSAQYSSETADDIFDPVLLGVITRDGLPGFPTPAVELRSQLRERPATVNAPATTPREQGDAAARCGDFVLALKYWHIARDHSACDDDVVHAREAIQLTGRLQQLLHVTWPA